jgi:endonuclease/exonuclease/phosphatase family metal-dependent hydrolase
VKAVLRLVLILAVCAFGSITSGCEFTQFNIANGHSAPENHGQDDVIAWVRGGWHPVAITLEEVCHQSFDKIQNAIWQYGYTGEYDNINEGRCGGAGYGNAIFHLGTRVGWRGQPSGRYVLHYKNQSGDHRHAMAIGISVGGRHVIVWVTHLENDSSTAQKQAAQLLDNVRFIQAASGWPLVVGGDFNLTADVPVMRIWRAIYSSAGGPTRPTHDSGRKYDYLFSSVGWTRAAAYPTSTSDHYRLDGGIDR